MRLSAIILTVALFFAIFSPVNLHMAISPDGQVKYFASLSVCDKSGPAGFSKGEIPSINEALCWPAPLEFAVAAAEPDYPSIVLSLFSVRIERPPKV